MDGHCNHLAATLFAIKDQWNNFPSDTYTALSKQQLTVPCTSQPCQWNLPKKRKLNTEPIQSLKFQKHDYGKKEKKHSARDQVDDRAPHQSTITDSKLKDLHDQVKKG